MKQTTNFHLNKPDTTDYYNIQDSNNNMDIIDAEIKEAQDKADLAFQSASNGKAAIKTAITGVDPTVTIPTDATFNQLAASIGQIKTGIDTEDATAAAGDIVAPKTAYAKGIKITGTAANNGPTVTETINLTTQNQEYTIASGFHSGLRKIKAVITNLAAGVVKAGVTVGGIVGTFTADASATAAQILSGMTAYVNGNKIIGTMPNKDASANWLASDIYTGGSGNILLKPQPGYYSPGGDSSNSSGIGGWVLANDANFVSSNIVAGKSVLGLIGTASIEKYDFPLSIQSAQPTAVAVGHIWVNSSTLAAQITTVKIMEALNAGAANGTLMLVIGSLSSEYQAVSQNKPLKSGTTVTFTVDAVGNTGSNWTVNQSGGVIKFPKPMVYSKAGGVLDIETAYMWNGSSWVMLSQKGNYVFSFTNLTTQNNYIYNKNGDTLVQNSIYTSPLGITTYGPSYSADGTFITAGGAFIMKRTGDVFSLFYTVPVSHTVAGYVMESIWSVKIALNGNRILVLYRAYGGDNYYYPCVISYLYNGITFVQEAVTVMTASVWATVSGFDITPDGGFFALLINNYYGIIYGFINGTGFTATRNTFGIGDSNYWTFTPLSIQMAIDKSGNTLWYQYHNGSYNNLSKLTIDRTNKVLNSTGIGVTNTISGNAYFICGIHPVSGDLFGYINNPVVFFVINGITGVYTVIAKPTHIYNMKFSADGTRMVAMDSYNAYSSSIGYYSVSGTGASTIFTLITSYTDSTNMASRVGVGIVPA